MGGMELGHMVQDVVGHFGKEGHKMPTLLTGARLRSAVEENTFIEDEIVGGVEGVKYDFHMGTRILKSSYGQTVDIEKLPEKECSGMSVEPGEVVFVLTHERLNLPKNIVAVLSPKRKLAHSGIMIMGGLTVDPLYKGVLWIGLYNFSSTAFPLIPGKKLIAAMFYELAKSELDEFPIPESVGVDEFPDELVGLIKNYRPFQIQSLSVEISDTQKRLDALIVEVRDDRNWKKDFQEALEKQSREIDKLLNGLREEKEVRKEEDLAIRNKLDSVQGFFAGVKLLWIIIALVVGAILSWTVPKLLG